MKDFIREEVFIKASKLAAVSTAAVVPNIIDCYFLNPGYRETMLTRATEAALPFLFAKDVILVFLSLLISGACGFAWSDGKKVAGFGTVERLRRDLKTLLTVGPALAVATAFLLDKGLLGHFPRLYPKSPVIALSIPLRAAFYEEVICHFGMLVIFFRLLRSVWAAIVLSAAFNAAMGLKSATFVGFPIELDWLTAEIVAAKLCLAAFFGYFYCRKGLMATVALRFIMELKHVALAAILTG